jgi:hypothetical protein
VGSVVFGAILGWFALVENPKLVQQLRRELQYAPRTPSTDAATVSAGLATKRTKLPVLPSTTLRLPDKQSVESEGDPEGKSEGDWQVVDVPDQEEAAGAGACSSPSSPQYPPPPAQRPALDSGQPERPSPHLGSPLSPALREALSKPWPLPRPYIESLMPVTRHARASVPFSAASGPHDSAAVSPCVPAAPASNAVANLKVHIIIERYTSLIVPCSNLSACPTKKAV